MNAGMQCKARYAANSRSYWQVPQRRNAPGIHPSLRVAPPVLR